MFFHRSRPFRSHPVIGLMERSTGRPIRLRAVTIAGTPITANGARTARACTMGMSADGMDMSVGMSGECNMGMSVGDNMGMGIRAGMTSAEENIGTIGIEVVELPGECDE